MRLRDIPTTTLVTILCAGAVVIAWPVPRNTAQAGETGRGTMVMAQEREGVIKPGPEAPEESKEGRNQTLKGDAKKALRDLNAQITVLGKQVNEHKSKVETDAKESWNDLKEKQRAAKRKLKELSSAAGEVQEKAKSDFKTALDDLRKSYDKAVSYFK